MSTISGLTLGLSTAVLLTFATGRPAAAQTVWPTAIAAGVNSAGMNSEAMRQERLGSDDFNLLRTRKVTEDGFRETPALVVERSFSPGVMSSASPEPVLRGNALHMIAEAEKHIAAGHLEKALPVLEKALKDPSARPFARLIYGAMHMNEATHHVEPMRRQLLDLALSELQDGALAVPMHGLTHANISLALLLRDDAQHGDLEQALEEARMALRLNPSPSKTRYVLGRVLLRLGHREEAIFHLKMAAVEIEGAKDLLAEAQGLRTASR